MFHNKYQSTIRIPFNKCQLVHFLQSVEMELQPESFLVSVQQFFSNEFEIDKWFFLLGVLFGVIFVSGSVILVIFILKKKKIKCQRKPKSQPKMRTKKIKKPSQSMNLFSFCWVLEFSLLLTQIVSLEMCWKEVNISENTKKNSNTPSETNSETRSSYQGRSISLTVIRASKNKYLPTESVHEKEEPVESFM